MKRAVLIMALILGCYGCNYINPITPIVQLGIYWYEGEAQKYYACSQPEVIQALRNVLEELKLPVTSESVDGNVFRMDAGDDDKFKIKVTAVREGVTKLAIRVNIMGDKPYAELIYQEIEKQPMIGEFKTLAELNDAIDNRQRARRLFR